MTWVILPILFPILRGKSLRPCTHCNRTSNLALSETLISQDDSAIEQTLEYSKFSYQVLMHCNEAITGSPRRTPHTLA